MVPLMLNQFGYDDGDFAVRALRAEIEDVIDDRRDNIPKGRAEAYQLRDRQAGGAGRLFHQMGPGVGQLILSFVERDVDCLDFLR